MSGRRSISKRKSSRGIKSRSLSPTSRRKGDDTVAPDVSFFKADWRITNICASSYDPRHPPTAVVEKGNSFWSSTGLYPQQFHITLSLPVRVSEFTVKSTGIKDLSVQGRAVRNMPYQEIAAKTYKNSKDQVLNVSLEKAGPIEQLRLIILSGLSDFCSIKNIILNGQAGRGIVKNFPSQIKQQPRKAPKNTIDVGSIKGNIQQRSPAAPVILKPVYSTYVRESDIIMQPIGPLWEIIATLNFATWMGNVSSTSLTHGPSMNTTGSLISIKYKDGSRWTVRLVAINEEKHYITWELVAAENSLGYTSRIDTIELKRCSKENWTYVEWRTDFSSDASLAVVEDAKHKRLEAFDSLETAALNAQS